VIIEVSPAGEIREPKHLRGRFHNAIGALVRDQLNPTIISWKKVLEETKRDLWEKFLMVNFWFLEGSHQLVKRQALKIMGELFRRWRSDLNKNYI